MKKLSVILLSIILLSTQAFSNMLSFSSFAPFIVVGMDINVLAGENYESAQTTKITSGTLGLTYDNKEEIEAHSTAAARSIKNAGGLILDTKEFEYIDLKDKHVVRGT